MVEPVAKKVEGAEGEVADIAVVLGAEGAVAEAAGTVVVAVPVAGAVVGEGADIVVAQERLESPSLEPDILPVCTHSSYRTWQCPRLEPHNLDRTFSFTPTR